MTHDLVERLRDPNYAGSMQHLRSYDQIDRLFNQAADKLEAYMADADAHVSRIDLVRRQEDEIRDLKAENDALRAERDEIRKSHQKMHRRCQQSERVEILTIGVLEGWYDFLNSGERRNRQDRLLFRWAIRDMRRKAAAIRNMGERAAHIACEHDWFDCSNAAVPPPAKSCRKCGWTVGHDETQGIYLIWPWLAGRAALEKEPRE
ncbi:hypothetical protein P9A16_32455 [Shinella sp. 838]|uniref:hypothetical protein n=1 Tax=Shinella sp. 838 TaxID=3038164 RepID=UPI0024154F1B|nr:hypothetical protein [Shinella sp. 838]MDG4675815.1 hypothetical protein [Shinella sp. 838]